jgi:hypothetical protein
MLALGFECRDYFKPLAFKVRLVIDRECGKIAAIFLAHA